MKRMRHIKLLKRYVPYGARILDRGTFFETFPPDGYGIIYVPEDRSKCSSLGRNNIVVLSYAGIFNPGDRVWLEKL